MKLFTFLFFILFLSHCGIDKESSVPLASINNSGELDTSYNGVGYQTFAGSAGGSGDDIINDMATDSQNRIVAVGSSVNASNNPDLSVWRFDEDGNLDTSFATAGIFIHHNAAGGNNSDVGYAVVVGPDDSIYIAGSSVNGSSNFDMVVWKLTSTGQLDTSFNGTGFLVDDSAAGGSVHDQGSGITLDSNNRVLVTGFSDQTATNRDVVVWRISTNGTLDTSFNSDGRWTHDSAAGGEDDQGNSIISDSTGSIYIGGRADAVTNIGDMALWKLTLTGNLDTTFNGSGFLTQNGAAGGNDLDSINDITFDAAENIIATGLSRNADGNNDMTLWKVTPTGSFDTSFNTVGFTSFDVATLFAGNSNDSGESVFIDSQGNIVVVGGGNENFCVWRYLVTGEIDTNFNTDGFFSHDSAAGGFGIDSGMGVAEDSKNRLYFGGFSENQSGNFDASIWRLQ